MANYTAGQASIDVLPSLKNFHKTLAAELKTINPDLGVQLVPNSAKFTAEVRRLTRNQKMQIQIEADKASLAKAEAAVKAAEARITDAKNASTDATAKQTIAEQKLEEVRSKNSAKASQISSAELKLSQSKRSVASASNDAKNAEEGLLAARQRLTSLQDDSDKRASSLGRLSSVLSGIVPGTNAVKTGLAGMASTAGKAVAGLAAIGPAASGILTIGRAAVSASQSLLLLPAALSVVGATIGTLLVGTLGVGDAFKQMDTAQAGAIKSASGLASAQQALGRAQVDATRSAEQAEISAARSVRSAEEALTQTKRSLADAQEAVNSAVRDATEQYQQLAFQARGAVLDERQAVLDLADAQTALDNARAAGISGKDLEAIVIAYQRQVLALDEAKDKNADLAKEQEKANAVGVQGSDQVVAAKRTEVDALDAVTKSQRDLNETQRDAAQSIADQQLQSSRAIADALQSVTDAQTGASGSVDKYKEALNKLSPNAKSFVETIKGLKGEFDGLKNSVQDKLFDGFDQDAKELAKTYFPLLKTGLGGIATELNGVGKSFVDAFKDKENIKSVSTVLDDTGGIVKNLGAAAKPLTSIFLDFASVGTGVLKDLTGNVGNLAQGWADWVRKAKDSGQLKAMITQGIDDVKSLGKAIFNFGSAAVTSLKLVAKGFGGLSEDSGSAAGNIESISEKILTFVQDGKQKFIEFGQTSRDAFTFLVGALKGAHDVLSVVYDVVKGLVGLFGGSLGTVGAFAGALFAINKITFGAVGKAFSVLGDGIANVFTKTVPKVDGFKSSLLKVGLAGGALLAVVGTMNALASPVVTGNVDKLTQSLSDFSDSGKIAGEASKVLGQNLGDFKDALEIATSRGLHGAIEGTTDFIGNLIGVDSRLDDANGRLKTLDDSLSQMAQKSPDQAQRLFGQLTTEAGLTEEQINALKEHLPEFSDAMDKAGTATDNTTTALKKQRDFIIGQASAAIRYQQSMSRVLEAQQALTEATAKYKQGSKEANDAQLSLSSAMLDSIDAAGNLSAAQTQGQDAATISAGATDAYNKQLAILAIQTGTDLPPAIKGMVDGLSNADLAAQGVTRSTDATKGSIDQLPGSTELKFPTDAPAAKADVDRLFDSVHNLVGEYGKWAQTYLDIIDLNKKLPAPAAGAPPIPLRNATGGFISGPGTGTSDSIPSMLSNGEFVVNAASTSKWLPLLQAMNSNRFAAGGLAGTSSFSSVPASGTASTDGLVALEATAATATDAIVELAKQISDTLNPVFDELQKKYEFVVLSMLKDTGTLTDAETQLGLDFQNIWQAIATSVNDSYNQQNVIFSNLANGLGGIRTALSYTADWAVTQWARMQEAAAVPVRWVLTNPMNAGIIAAWNQLNTDFSLGQAVAPIPIGFATGGFVSGPGTGTSDSIPARLSNGEFVIPADVTKRTKPFLEALRKGQPEALQAAGYAEGGLVADTGSQLDSKIFAAQQFAKAQDGKPYIWGGVGPLGYDCSGYMSAITNVLRGESNPYRRLGVAAGEPWAGFVPGLSSAFALGNSSVHTAGTLGGVNVESTGTHVRFGGDAHGADASQFSGHSSLPFVGGQFVPGGGPGLDPGALMASAFASSKEMIGQIGSMFPGNKTGVAAGGMASKAIEALTGYGTNKLSALTTASGGVAGSPEVIAAVRAVAQAFGWGDGPQWAALQSLIQGESGFNPNAANPTSSARGLFQKMTSVNGPIEPDIAGQTNWGLNYIKGRYGSPLAAYTTWLSRSPHWYSKGGVVPGTGSEDTSPAFLTPGERVLPVSVTRTFDRFVANIATAERLSANAISTERKGDVNLYQTVNPAPGMDERVLAADSSRRIAFGLRNQ